MSGLNFVKSNKEIDSMMLSPTSGKIKDEKNKKLDNNNLENISMDTPMESNNIPSSSNIDSERRVFSMPPPHPVAAQHYYRKLFSDQEPTRNEEQQLNNSHPNNNNLKSNNNYVNNGIYPYSGGAGFITPYTQPIYTMMPPQAFAPSYQPIVASSPSTISSIVTDSLLSLVKYLIFFLLSLGIFKMGKRWLLSLLKQYKIVERVPVRKESELVVKPEIKLEKREEEENSIIEETEPSPPKEKHRENATSGESTNSSLDFNSMMFLQREIFDLKLSLNEMKTKMGEMNNQSISNTLLKQIELQHEQQKMILSQTLPKNDKSSSSNELQRELNNLRNDLSQMKGMMMVSNHQPYSVAPPIIHREPAQYYPKYSNQSISPATSTSSNENKLIEHNLTSSAKASSPPTSSGKEEQNPSPVNYFNTYSSTAPTNYESGISKRSQQPSIDIVSKQPTEEKINQAQESTQAQDESKTTTPTNEEKTEESQFEYGQTFEPITEEEYDQVYGEYLNSLGKRFEDQVNFHTHAETSSETKTENVIIEESNVPSQESNPIVENNESNSSEAETPMTSTITTSKPFDEVDVFNILKTPTLSFDELFVKASPKPQAETSSVFNDATSPVVPIENNNNTATEISPSFVTPQASSSIQEAARELRKTQLTAKQKKSKIFGALLAPEKKPRKKKVKSSETPETPNTPNTTTTNNLAIETNVLLESDKPVDNPSESIPSNSFAPEIQNYSFAPEIPISMNTLSNPIIDLPSTESFEKFEMYDFENDERFQRMLSLTADDEDCPINKDDPNFIIMQKGIYFKQLLGNDDFDLEAYLKVKGIEIKQ